MFILRALEGRIRISVFSFLFDKLFKRRLIPIRKKSYVNAVDAYAARRPFNRKIVEYDSTVRPFEA